MIKVIFIQVKRPLMRERQKQSPYKELDLLLKINSATVNGSLCALVFLCNTVFNYLYSFLNQTFK